MKRAQLKHITHIYYRRLKKYIRLIPGDFNTEDLHRFRVVYKKLRALLRMLSQGKQTKQQIRISGKLKQAYIISGSIRDLQLQQMNIRKATQQTRRSPQGYLALLQKEIDHNKPAFNVIISGNIITKCKDRTDALLPQYFHRQDLNKFLLTKWKFIRDIISSGNQSDLTLHSIRKNLKDVYYTLKLFQKKKAVLPTDKIQKVIDIKKLDLLLQDLGNFQDSCVSVRLMRPKWLNNLKPVEMKFLTRIKQACRKDKSKLKKTIVCRLQAVIK